MIVRALDINGDWTFGKGRNDYRTNLDAVVQNISTRLKSFFGNCFFAQNDGIDWFNYLGSKDQLGLNLAINATILNTESVTGILQVSANLDHATRVFTVQYRVQTTYGLASNVFQYSLDATV